MMDMVMMDRHVEQAAGVPPSSMSGRLHVPMFEEAVR